MHRVINQARVLKYCLCIVVLKGDSYECFIRVFPPLTIGQYSQSRHNSFCRPSFMVLLHGWDSMSVACVTLIFNMYNTFGVRCQLSEFGHICGDQSSSSCPGQAICVCECHYWT